jgi:hypothetical protein
MSLRGAVFQATKQSRVFIQTIKQRRNHMPTQEQQEISFLKGRVSKLEAHLEFIYKHLGVTFVEDTRLSDDPKVVAALKANNLLDAIKFYRMATNTSFEEAKAGVEEMRTRLGM